MSFRPLASRQSLTSSLVGLRRKLPLLVARIHPASGQHQKETFIPSFKPNPSEQSWAGNRYLRDKRRERYCLQILNHMRHSWHTGLCIRYFGCNKSPQDSSAKRYLNFHIMSSGTKGLQTKGWGQRVTAKVKVSLPLSGGLPLPTLI